MTANWVFGLVFLVTLVGGALWMSRGDSQVAARATRDLAAFQKVEPHGRQRLLVIVRPMGDEAFGRAHPRQQIKPLELSLPNVPVDQTPFADSFVGNLSLRYVLDGDQLMLNVSPSMLKDLGIERAELLPLARTNLRRRYPDAQIERGDGVGIVTGAGDLESSWMVDFDFWKEEAKRFKGPLVASVPARDVMVWVDSAEVGLVADLRTRAAQIASQAHSSNRAVSSLLFAWRDDHWEVLPP